MTDSHPGPVGIAPPGTMLIYRISIFHAIVFHSPYPPAAGAVYAAAHAVRAVAGHLRSPRCRPSTAYCRSSATMPASRPMTVRHQLGLDHPLPVQFWHYRSTRPWRSWHRQRYRPAGAPRPAGGLPATLELATGADRRRGTGHRRRVLCARYAGSPWIWRFAPLPCWATRCPFSGSAC